MKTLLLLRHAKSSWQDAGLADFDRPLNERGMLAAPFMGALMVREGLAPEIILCSPAERARQTALLVGQGRGMNTEIRFEHRIYEASPRGLHQVVSELDDAYSSAMLVGHNPGVEGFISYLTGNMESMPTAALAVTDLQVGSWSTINDRCGSLRRIYKPREEMQ